MADLNSLTGTRIRERRLTIGLQQADLAARAGISASYLNLIEHNRRPANGRVLAHIAAALGVAPGLLTDTGGARVGALDLAARGTAASPEPTAEFAGRFPGWADVVLDQSRRIEALQERLGELTDRLTHDAELAASLHAVVGAVTAIRATAAILVGEPDLDRDWRARFHGNIHADAVRLAEASQRLARYLDSPDSDSETLMAPQEEVEWYLASRGFHLTEIEAGEDLPVPRLIGYAAQTLLAAQVARYRADARALPLTDLVPLARTVNYDPFALARQCDQPLPRILRRLASLPPGQGHPDFALVVADCAGVITHLRAMAGFAQARSQITCPLWPLWQAMTAPGRPYLADLALPGDAAPRLRGWAIAGPREWSDGPRAVIEATMLLRRDPPGTEGAVHEVGPGCRICPRASCGARREPAAILTTDL